MNNKHLSWYKDINNNFIIASRAYFLQNLTQETVEQLLNTPISGDSPADKVLEVSRHSTLAEHARLAQSHRNLIAWEQELADNSRQHQQTSRSVVWRGQDINKFVAKGLGDSRVMCTLIENV